MEEEDFLSTDSVEVDSKNRNSTLTADNSFKKEEHKVYQPKPENISVLHSQDVDNLKSSIDTGDHIDVDRVHSGESLFKTFTFEQTSDEDVEKCIAFWKSVMQKNLEPIKCSIIENSKPHTEVEKKESVGESEEQLKKIKEAEQKIHELYNKMWNSTFRQLKRERLDEIKLIGKSRCKMCEGDIISTSKQESYISKEEIVELNEWDAEECQRNVLMRPPRQKPKSEPLPEVEQEKSEKSEKPELRGRTSSCVCSPLSTESQDSMRTVISDRIFIPPDTNRYRLRDLVQEKKKTGAYSRWRRNITLPCTCGVEGCDCNLNPAIIAMNQKNISCGCGQLQCNCKKIEEEKKKKEEEQAEEEIEEIEEVSKCTCDHPECKCSERTESQFTVRSGKILLTEEMQTISKDTIEYKPGEEPDQNAQMYVGPSKMKRTASRGSTLKCDEKEATSSKDTLKASDTNSKDTVKAPPSESDTKLDNKCICEGECTCKNN